MKLIIGTGSHAEVIEEIYHAQNIEDIFFCSYDDYVSSKPHFLGNVFHLTSLDDYDVIIGIGDNLQRKKVAEDLVQKFPHVKFDNAIHPTAYIADNVKMGTGNVICPGVMINTHVKIGNHNIINTLSSVDHHGDIRDYVHLAPKCALCGHVTIHDQVFLGVGCNVTPRVSIKPCSFYKAHSLIKSSSVIKIYEPYLKDCKQSVLDAIESGWVSSQGEFIHKTSRLLESMLNVKHALLVFNGTVATHCLFLALKFKYPDITKIYVPNNVYVAAVNCALMEYEMSQLEVLPINAETYNMFTDEASLAHLDPGAAVLIVHNVGNIINVPRLQRLRPDLVFVEDNCEGLFGQYEGHYAGTQSFCSSISFFGNKTITSGEGGAVLTNDTELYQYLSRKINQGNTSTRYVHDILGYNYRMTNLQAALLYDQLQISGEIRRIKKELFDGYTAGLGDHVLRPASEPETIPSNWMYILRFPGRTYQELEKYFTYHGIECRPFFYPLCRHVHLKSLVEPEEVSETLSHECVMIPSHCYITEQERDYILYRINQIKSC